MYIIFVVYTHRKHRARGRRMTLFMIIINSLLKEHSMRAVCMIWWQPIVELFMILVSVNRRISADRNVVIKKHTHISSHSELAQIYTSK